MIHDCDMSILYSGQDKDKLKAIARTEPVNVKVHSGVVTVPPLFLFITSNQHLMTHSFEPGTKFIKNVYESNIDAQQHHQKRGEGGRKRKRIYVDPDDLKAVRARYLEMFIRKRPTLPSECLPEKDSFSRENAIQGIYSRIIAILVKYETRKEYKSPYLFLYGIAGLCKNIILMNPEYHSNIKTFIYDLFEKLELDQEEINQLIELLLCKNDDDM